MQAVIESESQESVQVLSLFFNILHFTSIDSMIVFNIYAVYILIPTFDLGQSVTNIFEYSNIQMFVIRIFIRIFVRIIFGIQIYLDIRWCQLFRYKYIQIFIRINFQISAMFLFNLMKRDILFITMNKNAI